MMPYPVAAARSRPSAQGLPISPPAGFGWTNPPLTIYKTPSGFSTSFSTRNYAPTGKAYYVDNVTGNNANAGTIDAPLQHINVAVAKADVVVVYVKPGVYHYTTGAFSGTITKNIAMRRWPGETGRIVCTNARTDLTFVLDGTYTNCFTVTRANVGTVLDVANTDVDGDYVELAQVADAATCDSTTNSWAQVGTALYVHRADSAQPTISNTWALVNYAGGNFSGNYTWYVEHFDMYNAPFSASATAVSQAPKLYLYYCSIKFSKSGSNGLFLYGSSIYSQNCVLAKNDNDGVNVNDAYGNVAYSLELNTVSYKNGIMATDNNNQGSSAHTGFVIRLNCEYYGNRGGNTLDTNGQSWCLGCNLHDSIGTDIDNCNFGSAVGPMWLDGCISSGSTYDLRGGTIYYRDLTSGGNNIGTCVPY